MKETGPKGPIFVFSSLRRTENRKVTVEREDGNNPVEPAFANLETGYGADRSHEAIR